MPFFNVQRQQYKSRAEQAAEAKAKAAPVPSRSLSRPDAGAPKAGEWRSKSLRRWSQVTKPCAWGKGLVFLVRHHKK